MARSSREGLWKPLQCFCRGSSLRLAGSGEREDGRHTDGWTDVPAAAAWAGGRHHSREGRSGVAGRGLAARSREHGWDTPRWAGEQVAQC